MGIELLPEIWPDWKVEEQIGEGAFGKVYKAVRNDSDFTAYAAIKLITVPRSESEIESLQADGISLVGAKSYLQGIVSDFINEIRLMESMKGTSNIVSVEDYKVVEKKEGIGWDIFIRMELLTPLVKKLACSSFTEREVIKLGIDICSALELCLRCNIVHRDIKPENIFISNFGDYKIGDFGIARQLEKTNTSLSSKGTFNYIAPEVAKGYKYDARVDIYSLGIVLYKLLNNNRLPFIPLHKDQLSYGDKKLAVDRRLSGEPLPPPVNASKGMAAVIDMACRYNPEERFATPTAMKNALIRLLNQSYIPIDTRHKPTDDVPSVGKHVKTHYPPKSLSDNDIQSSRRTAKPTQKSGTMSTTQSITGFDSTVNTSSGNNKDGSGKGVIIAIILVALIAIAVIIFAFIGSDKGKNVKLVETSATSTTNTTLADGGFDVVKPDYYYSEPLYRYVDVDDQYDGDPVRMRTGPGKDGTEKMLEIPDGNYVYIHGGLSDRNDWVYVEFQGNYGWVLSKYLHNVG